MFRTGYGFRFPTVRTYWMRQPQPVPWVLLSAVLVQPLIAFATEREKEIEEAMISTFAGYDIHSFGHILKADNQGATYVEISE